ncbi:hypothetical protein Syun_025498 [Stephania yunnanensis]|uniref:Uncharacterized protein n=1 Tax=Stephania yunnanensis TaxID=152371 RepID=A0AAP0EYY3_9MAGN
MFVPRPPSVNLPPYHFDPYAPGPSSSHVDHGMPHPQMYPSLPQYMPSPYTPTPYNYNIPYSGDVSFINLLTMPQPHVPFPQPPYRKPVFWDGSTSYFLEHQEQR